MTEEEREKQREENRARYAQNRVAYLENKREYYQKRKKEIKKKNSLYKKLNPWTDRKYALSIKGKYRDYKKGAKSRGLKFEITLKDFSDFKGVKCHYCGDVFEEIGIDRVDNKLGYVKGNMESCCPICNRMKHAFTKKEFVEKCIKIAHNHINTI